MTYKLLFSPGERGVVPYMGHIRMFHYEGYGFQVLYSRIGYKESLGSRHRRTGNFFARGGGKPCAQKIMASCPNLYETVVYEKKRGSYFATT